MRRFALGYPPVWLIALAITAVLLTASVIALVYIRSPTAPSPVESPSVSLLLVGAGALLVGAVARAALRRWWAAPDRARRELGQPAEGVRAEPHSSPIEVTVEYALDNTRTFILRLEPHHDPGTQTVQEAME